MNRADSYDAVPLIPRDVLFGNPDRVLPSLSPDGSKIAYIAPDEGVLNVWVGPSDSSAPARPVTGDRDRGIRTFRFCHDDRHLLYLQDTGGDENWRLYAIDLETGAERELSPSGSGVQAYILAHNRWHPHEVLIGLNDRDAQVHDVHRIDLRTGERTLVEKNPGFAGWLVDSDLVVRGGVAVRSDGAEVVQLRDGDGGEFETFLEIAHEDTAGTGVVGFGRDGRSVLVQSTVDANASRLLQVDLDTGAQRVLAADDTYDIGGVVLDPQTLEPQLAVVAKDRDEYVLLDDAIRADIELLTAHRDAELGISRAERTDRVWLVTHARPDRPAEYSVYDRSTGEIRPLFVHKEALLDYTLAQVEPFQFTARDGLTVHGYVTFPVAAARSGLPCVVLVHGGPWVRDSWSYHPEVQWLANRGYAVLQVNYRGSTGYGKAFTNAGDKQWGASMHDDLVDAVQHAVDQSWVDEQRAGIYGGSYGGYAALAGAAFTPEAFRCAVDMCGPSNLLTLIASVPEYWKPMIAELHQRIGDPATDEQMLQERSPLNSAHQIRIPVLVAQGANDPRVKQAEAEEIVAALRDRGLDHEYLLFEDEGHGLAKPENRERFYAVAEPFLARHLGGRQQRDQSGATG
ncbi:MAG: alpha/beta fold hydrolase [Streptosporangiales bacterium]|nr:alpha/beta fold hydrolase [Streptosporangiales bacterium]